MTEKKETTLGGGQPEASPWTVLSGVNVSDRIEKKNNMSYLSWAWAWGELKNHYPYAWFRKHETANGWPCFYDLQGYAFVKVTVGLDRTGDHEVTEILPVLDHKNKPIQGPNAFDVNTALQRCLTKAIAYLGLGHYIYAGEDMPPDAGGDAPPAPLAARTGAISGSGVPDHPAPTFPPTGGAQDETPTIHYPDGSGQVQNDSPEIIAATFLSFIPLCKTNESLTLFYTSNRAARDYLSAKDPVKHAGVLAAFSSAKRAFTSETSAPITSLKPNNNGETNEPVQNNPA